MSVKTIAAATIGPLIALGLLLIRRLRKNNWSLAKSLRCAALEAAEKAADLLCQ